MERLEFSIFFCVLLLFLTSITNAASDLAAEDDQVYVVYMGGKGSSSPGILREDQGRLLSTFLERNVVVQIYKHGFTGFAARMTKEEANLIAQVPGVVSVFPDKMLKLYTTRSWDFLRNQNTKLNNFDKHQININSSLAASSNSTAKGADIIVGLVDTGVWPESKSFNDKDMGPIPSRWKGTCVATKDFPSSSCNRKLIGARHFHLDNRTCRDYDGHGSHTASTATGAAVPGVSYYGLARGTAIGGSPTSRLAVYKACYEGVCPDSAILAAFDAAISDGVDIMSLSLGGSPYTSLPIWTDSVAVGGFHAVEHGIMVVCAAGNSGPIKSTVINFTPWLTSVAASTIDRLFDANVVLGNSQVIKGGAFQFSCLKKSPIYPLIDGTSAAYKNASNDAARNCQEDSYDVSKFKGMIVLCYNEMKEIAEGKIAILLEQGALGVILVDDDMKVQGVFPIPRHLNSPFTVISAEDADVIVSYIHSNRNPTATILKAVTTNKYKPAPVIVDFSSRGPSLLTHNLLKPDIAAPGHYILAAYSKADESTRLPGKASQDYVFDSGTSMACPHVAGLAASVKSQNPTWDHSAIRSAIMTTAVQTDNSGHPIMKIPGLKQATPYDFGAGEISTSNVANPGLVYQTEIIDYYVFLCNYGYDLSKIKLIAQKIPDGFSCPKNAGADLISNMNYPSIAVAKFKHKKKVTRTVTNVGDEDETVYTVKVDTPENLNVQVVPEKLQFTKDNKKRSFDVIFRTQYNYDEDVFGWITWSNGKYRVCSPFVLSLD